MSEENNTTEYSNRVLPWMFPDYLHTFLRQYLNSKEEKDILNRLVNINELYLLSHGYTLSTKD